MAEAKVIPDKMIHCPLLGKDIPEAMCYEINKVIDGDVKKNFVPDVKDWDSAKRVCPSCEVSYYKDVRDYRKEPTQKKRKAA